MTRNLIGPGNRTRLLWPLPALICLLALPSGLLAANPKLPVVPKWGRFERAFKSSFTYANPLQDITLKVRFTSPLGESTVVDAFWDGGRTWRVRFCPDQPGRWTYETISSDSQEQGLRMEIGRFLCTAPAGPNRFRQHGPVRVARDRRHLEHADGTPFFWLADTVWNGARVSAPKDWDLYAQVRSSQKFTVAQWTVAPGRDAKNQPALTGFPERIGINPGFFQRLDAKLDKLSQAGILSAIVPLSELDSTPGGAALPEDQATLLIRYAVARWGSEPVAWLLAFDGDTQARKVGRWKRIGQAVFAAGRHAPVVLYPGRTPWLLDEFRDQPWVDAFGIQGVTDVTDDALKWTFAGPFPQEWLKAPPRPLIPFTPCENGFGAQSKKRFTSDDVRHAAWWSLLLTPPAGLSYAGQGMTLWDTTVEPRKNKIPGATLPLWQKAMFMPAAKQMSLLAQFMTSLDFWQLRPQPKFIASQPGDSSPGQYEVGAASETRSLALAYVPEARTLDLSVDALPSSLAITWFNPRTGANSSAVAVVGERTCQLPTPEPGDWLLVIKAGKQGRANE